MFVIKTCRSFQMASSSSFQSNANALYFDQFTCSICLEVLHEPVQCVKNEHYFCKRCITKHLKRSKTCPVCQDKLTPETLRPISRVVANLFEQFLSLRCKYASRGCTSAARDESLLSHEEECGFAPVQCSHEGCEATVNRQDLVSHQQTCEFRSVICDDCREAMRQREYKKHPCVFRKELEENKRGLAEVWRVLREIQDEQRRQGEQMRQIAGELRQPRAKVHGQPTATLRQQGENSRQPERGQPDATKTPFMKLADAEIVNIPNPVQQQAPGKGQIVVVGGRNRSYEVFNWATWKWTLYEDALFFDHTDGFSFVYDNKVMICGGTSTNKMECLHTNNRSVSSFPAQLPGTECGKGVVCGDHVITFGESISSTSLKPPFKTKLIAYRDDVKLSAYAVACVNENAVVVIGGCFKYPVKPSAPYRGTEFRQDVLLYNPTTKVMTNLAAFPYQIADMAVVLHDGNLIILGGHKNYGGICSDVLMYDVTNQHCSKLPSMLQRR